MMFPQSRHSASSQQLKFTTSDSCDRIKDEFQFLQAQYHRPAWFCLDSTVHSGVLPDFPMVSTSLLGGSSMEIVGEPRPFLGPWNLLGVPGMDFHALDMEYDREELVIRIRYKSSGSEAPLERSPLLLHGGGDLSDGNSEPETLLSRYRNVSFADSKGLSLVRVKVFDRWDIPKLPSFASLESEKNQRSRRSNDPTIVSAPFSLPLPSEEVATRVQKQKLVLETVEFIPGTTTLRGVIRVLNLSFDKTVYVRTTLDAWASHFELLAEYVPDSSDEVTDRFVFKLTLVRPFKKHWARVEFCLRYETSVGTFWDNNADMNYVLFCHQRAKETSKEDVPKQHVLVCKKSCLKTISEDVTSLETKAKPQSEAFPQTHRTKAKDTQAFIWVDRKQTNCR